MTGTDNGSDAAPAGTLDDLKAGAELYVEAAAQAVGSAGSAGRDLKARAELYTEAAAQQWQKVRASACDLSKHSADMVRKHPVRSLIALGGIAAIAALLIHRRRR